MVSTNVKTYFFDNDHLEDIITVLNSGGVVVYPTDTIWGVGCDACNAAAVEKVYALKKRSRDKGFVILVDSIEMLKKYVAHVHPRVDTLLHYHERPLTVVFDQARNLPANVCPPDGSIGVRIVKDEFCRLLIRHFGRPLVSSSANVSNESFQGTFGSISSEILTGADYVVKYRQHEKFCGPPSVIVKALENGELEFLRT